MDRSASGEDPSPTAESTPALVEVLDPGHSGLGRAGLAALGRAAAALLGLGPVEFTVLLAEPGRIAELNREYRGESRPTDTLAFPLREPPIPPAALDRAQAARWVRDESARLPAGARLHLGDVVICPEVARDNAERHGAATHEEVRRLLVHALLHLLGFDHASPVDQGRMQAEETFLLERLPPARPPRPPARRRVTGFSAIRGATVRERFFKEPNA